MRLEFSRLISVVEVVSLKEKSKHFDVLAPGFISNTEGAQSQSTINGAILVVCSATLGTT
jgi:hypothetical protein